MGIQGKCGAMSQIHAKTDKLSLVAVPQPDSRMRVTSSSLEDPLVILPLGFGMPWQETITPNLEGRRASFRPRCA